MNFKKVAVLMGGTSNEREVSLQSGANVVDALKSLGEFEVLPVRLDSDDLSAVPDGIDAAFLALHGGYGENGGVQAALDARGIPYTGPGAAASRITIDKVETKKVLDAAGVPNAPWCVVGPEAVDESPLPLPVVVKPPKDGSSVGISRVMKPEEWRPALELAIKVDREKNGGGRALVEAFIPGREWTVGILDGEVLPVIEIRAPDGWYGYDEKYRSNATRYVFPEDEAACRNVSCTPDACATCGKKTYDLAVVLDEARRQALAAWNAVGCRGVTRVDFRVSPEGRVYVLELNTVPGFTAHSLVPKAAARTGLSFPALCGRILKAAAHD